MMCPKESRRCLRNFLLCCLLPFLHILLLPVNGWSQEKPFLPDPVMQELKKAKVPVEAVGMYVQPLSQSGKPRISGIRLNEGTPYVPASTMKVLTTYSALEILGPDYHWKTAVYSKGVQDGEVLDGDLIFRGSGDPKFNLEKFWLLLRQIRSKGIREIRGDLILDRSAFEPRHFDPAAFDNDPFRPYNAGPDALLLNHKVLEVMFRPNGLDGTVEVQLSPELEGVTITPPALKDVGECNGWQKEISLAFSEKDALFEGQYPLSCGEQTWLVYPYSMNDSAFFRAVFTRLWKELGGTFAGEVREGAVPQDAMLLAEWSSPPLSEVIRDVNKYSNNVMARHVLMAVGTKSSSEPASPEQGAFAVRSFLAAKGISLNGLQIENGSGLSRIERISPQTMGDILVAAYQSAVMPELLASLPIAGRDGTLWRSMRQTSVAGKAHLKTGAIQDVRAIAGYVLAVSGERYAVVLMVNHPNAASAIKARDALLVWIHDNG
ncbi:D-alanyl-D-alanine carboxypeptidase/D-alanyl-D-alanine-endopeptidase [Oxalobacter sp. OttesenSCG-928-P03]|nr:D-alanyl-D-alanine carboxypeptidase/D-alanyl-D-alanine-endopeptidase [Oxalobacter sp. OttesenSCG-928-P03]